MAEKGGRPEAPLGTERSTQNGYITVKTPQGWVYKHRLIMEEKLGRELQPNEQVYFLDGNKSNFDPDNIDIRQRKQGAKRERTLKAIQQRLYRLEERVERELQLIHDSLSELE